jgi:hypothetical protein
MIRTYLKMLKALDICEKVMDPLYLYVVNLLNNLAKLYDNIGKYEKAITLWQRIENNSNYPKQ